MKRGWIVAHVVLVVASAMQGSMLTLKLCWSISDLTGNLRFSVKPTKGHFKSGRIVCDCRIALILGLRN